MELTRFIDELHSTIETNELAKNDRHLKGLVQSLTHSKSSTKITDNAIVQAQTVLSWVGNKSFDGIIEESTFSFSDLQKGEQTIYLVVPEEHIQNCASWVRIMLESAVFSLEDVNFSKGKSTSQLAQEERVLFLLDELPAFGQLDIVSSGMATLRGRGVNLWLFIQNIAQLEATYGKEKARVIIGNAAALQVFGSNELEELEYFTRLIGEEFFDVQSITAGRTITDGESETESDTRTFSNSESVTNATGRADTVAEAKTYNWSTAISNSRNISRSRSRGGSIGSGSTRGTSSGSSEQYNESGDNRSTNASHSNQSSSNRNKSWQKSDTVGHAKSNTETHGGGSSETHSTTSNESTSRTRQTGSSQATGTSTTKSHSHAENRSFTVKQERLKVETVRSLREKFSQRGQMILVRGHHPFFAPQLSYFTKFSGSNRYMFPEMAALTSIQNFKEIMDRAIHSCSIVRGLPSLESGFDKKMLETQKYLANDHRSEVTHGISIQYFHHCLSEGINTAVNKYLEELKKYSREMLNHQEMLALISELYPYFKRWDRSEIIKEIDSLSEEGERLAALDIKTKIQNLINPFMRLPLRMSYADRTDDTRYYQAAFLDDLYKPIMSKLFNRLDAFGKDMDSLNNDFLRFNERVKTLSRKLLDNVVASVDNASRSESKRKQDFFMNKNK